MQEEEINDGDQEDEEENDQDGGNMDDGSDDEDSNTKMAEILDKQKFSLSDDEHQNIDDEEVDGMQMTLTTENMDKKLLETARKIVKNEKESPTIENDVNTWRSYKEAVLAFNFKGEFKDNRLLLLSTGIDEKTADCNLALDATVSTQIMARTWMAAANVVAEQQKRENEEGVDDGMPLLTRIDAIYTQLLASAAWREQLQEELRRALIELPIFHWNPNPSDIVNEYQFTFDAKDHFTRKKGNWKSDKSEAVGEDDDEDEETKKSSGSDGEEDENSIGNAKNDMSTDENSSNSGGDDNEEQDGENDDGKDDTEDEVPAVTQVQNNTEDDTEEVAPTMQVKNAPSMLGTTSKLDTGSKTTGKISEFPKTDLSDRLQGEDKNEEKVVSPKTDSGINENAEGSTEAPKNDKDDDVQGEHPELTADGESLFQQLTEEEKESESKEQERMKAPIHYVAPKKQRGRGRPPGSKKTKTA